MGHVVGEEEEDGEESDVSCADRRTPRTSLPLDFGGTQSTQSFTRTGERLQEPVETCDD